jgi:penicillin-binding protein 1B
MKDASYIPLFTEAPPGVEYAWINPYNGMLSVEGCNGAILVPFIDGSQPVQRDNCQSRLLDSVDDAVDESVDWFRKLLQ